MALVETLFMADVTLEWENRWTKLAVNKESVARPPSPPVHSALTGNVNSKSLILHGNE